MTNLSRLCFTYFVKFTDKETFEVLWYYGSRTKKRCHPKQLGVSYKTRSEYVHEALSSGSYDVEWFVHKTFGEDFKACLSYEAEMINWLQAHKSLSWLNMHDPKTNEFSTAGREWSEAERSAQSHRMIGKNKGKKRTPEQNSAMSKALTGRTMPSKTVEQRAEQSARQTGKKRGPYGPQTDAQKRAKSERQMGKPRGPWSQARRDAQALRKSA